MEKLPRSSFLIRLVLATKGSDQQRRYGKKQSVIKQVYWPDSLLSYCSPSLLATFPFPGHPTSAADPSAHYWVAHSLLPAAEHQPKTEAVQPHAPDSTANSRKTEWERKIKTSQQLNPNQGVEWNAMRWENWSGIASTPQVQNAARSKRKWTKKRWISNIGKIFHNPEAKGSI